MHWSGPESGADRTVLALPARFHTARHKRLRYSVFTLAGRILTHAGKVILRIGGEAETTAGLVAARAGLFESATSSSDPLVATTPPESRQPCGQAGSLSHALGSPSSADPASETARNHRPRLERYPQSCHPGASARPATPPSRCRRAPRATCHVMQSRGRGFGDQATALTPTAAVICSQLCASLSSLDRAGDPALGGVACFTTMVAKRKSLRWAREKWEDLLK